jgi:hypothetical protein
MWLIKAGFSNSFSNSCRSVQLLGNFIYPMCTGRYTACRQAVWHGSLLRERKSKIVDWPCTPSEYDHDGYALERLALLYNVDPGSKVRGLNSRGLQHAFRQFPQVQRRVAAIEFRNRLRQLPVAETAQTRPLSSHVAHKQGVRRKP